LTAPDYVSHYHSLLKGNHADDAVERLDAGVRRHGLYFDSRPICNVLRPFFISGSRYVEIVTSSTRIISAIHKVYRALLESRELRAELGVSEEEEEFIGIQPGYSYPDASGRLDAFLDSRGSFGIVEYNPDSPGGLLYGDVLGDIFTEMSILYEFSKKYRVHRIPIRPLILETLVSCYRRFGWSDHPNIAIVDWRSAKTRAEFELSREYFEANGYKTRIVDPDELEYRGGWLSVQGLRIHIVYKRVLVGELIERGGSNHPLVRAARDRAVCVVNSFRVQLLFRKSILALLQDQRFESTFANDERIAIRKHVPWTRRVREQRTDYDGKQIDLVEFLLKHRERLVLKPDGAYGGTGVVLGWEASDEAWQQALRLALSSDYVVQERVEVLEEEFPSCDRGKITLTKRYVDFDPYVWSGESVEGAGVRLSTSSVLNVTAGGGSAAPVFIVG